MGSLISSGKLALMAEVMRYVTLENKCNFAAGICNFSSLIIGTEDR